MRSIFTQRVIPGHQNSGLWAPQALYPALGASRKHSEILSLPGILVVDVVQESMKRLISFPFGYPHGLITTFAHCPLAKSSNPTCIWLMGITWLISRSIKGDSWITCITLG